MLTDSPIQRIQKILGSGGRSIFGKRTHHARASKKTGTHTIIPTARPLDRLRTWALQLERLRGHNKAAVALANKLARIAWAVWKHGSAFTAVPTA